MSEQTSEKLSDPQNKKIFHYNFSFAYSADKYFLQGTPLSERSSVLQKFINTKNDKTKITFDELEKYRSEIYDKQLDHLKSILNKVDNPDYFGLTELIVQMPNGNHAYYNHLEKKLTNTYVFPEGKTNEDYGVAKMLIKLGGLIEDKSEVKSVESEVKSAKYDIFYDNIVHIDFKYGEGVGMLVKKGLVDNYLEWDGSTRGVDAKLIDINEKRLHFWSTDSGYALDNKNLFKNQTGGFDYGRPFIMTAGLYNKTLRIFSNFHGPNLSNLWYSEKLNEDKKPINAEQLKNIDNDELKEKIYKTIKNSIEESINKGLKKSNLSNDAINKCEIYFTCDSNDSTGSLLEMILKDGINVNLPDNNQFTVTFNYDQITNVGKEENENTEGKEENENTKGLGKYKNIRTCCANCDSINDGRDITSGCSLPAPIYYANNDNTKTDDITIHYVENKINKVTYDNRTDTFTIDKSIVLNENFINPANYGYNGDYSLYGTSNNPPPMKMTIYEGFVDEDHTIPSTEKKTPLSDHQGIMSEPSHDATKDPTTEAPAEGGKRRRTRRKNKNKNAKKTNKKGKSKKYRKKGRKTRKIRRRK